MKSLWCNLSSSQSVFASDSANVTCHTWRSCRNAQTWSWVRFRYIGRSWIWHLPYITFAKPSSIYFTKLAELPLWCRLFFTNDFSKEWNNWYLISFHFYDPLLLKLFCMYFFSFSVNIEKWHWKCTHSFFLFPLLYKVWHSKALLLLFLPFKGNFGN